MGLDPYYPTGRWAGLLSQTASTPFCRGLTSAYYKSGIKI